MALSCIERERREGKKFFCLLLIEFAIYSIELALYWMLGDKFSFYREESEHGNSASNKMLMNLERECL